jgi:spore maturation protein B
MTEFSNWMIPGVFAGILLYGCWKRCPVFDSFVSGATEGFSVVADILPTFLGLMAAVGALRASGTLDLMGQGLKPVGDLLRMPVEVITVAMTKVLSSSAATGLVLDILETYGPDSLEGRMTGIMLGSTETIFYTMSVYFMAVKIKKTRYTLAGAIVANIAGILASVWLTYRVFYGS